MNDNQVSSDDSSYANLPISGDSGQEVSQNFQGNNSWHKEAEPKLANESIPLMELEQNHEMEPEVESWLEKVEQGDESRLSQQVKDDSGQVLVANATDDLSEDNTNDVVVLPLTEAQIEQGLHMKVYESMRWLAEWCVRVAKLLGHRVRYRQN